MSWTFDQHRLGRSWTSLMRWSDKFLFILRVEYSCLPILARIWALMFLHGVFCSQTYLLPRKAGSCIVHSCSSLKIKELLSTWILTRSKQGNISISIDMVQNRLKLLTHHPHIEAKYTSTTMLFVNYTFVVHWPAQKGVNSNAHKISGHHAYKLDLKSYEFHVTNTFLSHWDIVGYAWDFKLKCDLIKGCNKISPLAITYSLPQPSIYHSSRRVISPPFSQRLTQPIPNSS